MTNLHDLIRRMADELDYYRQSDEIDELNNEEVAS